MEPTTKLIELNSQTLNEKLYIKNVIRGITGDHNTILISTTPEIDPFEDSSDDFIFKGWSPFYYKFTDDSLIVYTMKESIVPRNFNTNIKIVQVTLPNPDMIQFNDQYEKLGFIKLR